MAPAMATSVIVALVAVALATLSSAVASAAPVAGFPDQFTTHVQEFSPEASATKWGVFTSTWAYDITAQRSRVDSMTPTGDIYVTDFEEVGGSPYPYTSTMAHYSPAGNATSNFCYATSLAEKIKQPLPVNTLQAQSLWVYNGTTACKNGGGTCDVFKYDVPAQNVAVTYWQQTAGTPDRFERLSSFDTTSEVTRNETYVFSSFVMAAPAASVFDKPKGC